MDIFEIIEQANLDKSVWPDCVKEKYATSYIDTTLAGMNRISQREFDYFIEINILAQAIKDRDDKLVRILIEKDSSLALYACDDGKEIRSMLSLAIEYQNVFAVTRIVNVAIKRPGASKEFSEIVCGCLAKALKELNLALFVKTDMAPDDNIKIETIEDYFKRITNRGER